MIYCNNVYIDDAVISCMKNRARYVLDLWKRHGDQKGGSEILCRNYEVYLSYMRNIEGIDVDKDRKIDIKGFKDPDYKTFWEEVVRVNPKDYTIADLDWLISECGDINSATRAVTAVGFYL